MKQITILGATGSVGGATLDVIQTHKDKFEVHTLTGWQNVEKLTKIAKQYRAKHVVIGDEAFYKELKEHLYGTNITITAGIDALDDAATMGDIVVAAITGAAGIRPVFAAAKKGKTIALANKEAIVAAGPLIMDVAKNNGGKILPIDSEHNAVLQCLDGEEPDKITLTASGGPFLNWPIKDIFHATRHQALRHPTWEMGAKISIDSATMMNKGLELIEAHVLFNTPASRLGAVIHPQSIVHAMVSYADGSTLAHMAYPDMKVPIAYALGDEKRLKLPHSPLSLNRLDFYEVNEARYPVFSVARQALETGWYAWIALSAANEIAVDAFLKEKIVFGKIEQVVKKALDNTQPIKPESIEDVLRCDLNARQSAIKILHQC